ncbi:unnamed protein product [Phytophthora fragariaefolia]|uniref:Unnamed protein product n=1 Tax=Phytophthora fragariaefolia TaxID=1490495 RepID=A0A9W6YAP5_9STRA|nr:unnamed protein product [Phytophthora fragariaefolia]
MAQFVPEMEQVLVEMNRAFEILVPTLDAFDADEEKSTPAVSVAVAGEDKHNEEVESTANCGPRSKNKHDEEDSGDVQWGDVDAPLLAGLQTEGGEGDDDIEWESVEPESNTVDSSVQGDASDDEDTDDHMDINDIVKAYGLGSSSYHLTIEVSKQVCEESSENDALFRNLADGALRMRKRFLLLLDDWEQHSILTGSSVPNSTTVQNQREILQQIQDLRDRMTRALLKWDDLVQGAKTSNRKLTQPAVVSMPLDAYNPPTKRQHHTSNNM